MSLRIGCFTMVFFVGCGCMTSIAFGSNGSDHKEKPKQQKLEFDLGMIHGKAQIKFKPESFFLKNVNMLNNDNAADKTYVSRSTLDVNLDFLYGNQWYGHDIAELFVTFRNKGVWGNPESIAQTTGNNVKLLEVVFGGHRHFITRHIIWIREMWMKFCINDAFGISFPNKQYFTLGAFPFELGRGIALGSAYAVGPRVLGFYSDNIVDQYAFGFKFSGDVFADDLSYDAYVSILENKSDSFASTAAKIRGQEFGRKLRQERGAGNVNFIVAGRLKWFPIKEKNTLVSFEPYALYNRTPEQMIEFPSDASSKLGTFGLAGEFVINNFEWGFDTAFNVGGQSVKGWDRNIIEFENRSGSVIVVNSRVHDTSATGDKTIYVSTSDAQKIIDLSAQDASQNGKLIGNAGGSDLYNDNHRFRNPSHNTFKGWMFVADAAYSLGYNKNQKIAATFGYASGDKNPNQDLENPNESDVDGDFKGFIGLQEIYSGREDRVQSVFLLGGTGRVPRPLFIPTTRAVYNRLPSLISGFTNLIFCGLAYHCNENYCDRDFSIRPNILAYWQPTSTNAFDISTGQSSTKNARDYLGIEFNTFANILLFDGFKLFAVGSLFIPGTHFADIKGTPLTSEELRLIDRRDRTGITKDVNPLLGDDVAYTLNLGLEYRF
jgi:hypothetical protein